jgi:tRNA (mo5U34)-methyltransferase
MKLQGTPAELQAMVDAYYWHHSIDFGNGVVTKGTVPLPYVDALARSLFDGLDLAGKSLVDVGAWNGAYSFEAKKRGAGRVLATDHYCWDPAGFNGRETFDLALSINRLGIEALDIDVPELSPASVGLFDAVLFSGVFYHLLTPVHLTKRVAECARHVLILETHQDFLESEKPGMVFYPGTTLNGDPSNWWGPNPHAMYEMLKEFGFARVFYQNSPVCDNPNEDTFRKRGVYHAYRSDESLAAMGGKNPNWVDLADEQMRANLFRPLVKAPESAPSPIDVLNRELAEAREENRRMAEEIRALRGSTSWRITAPLRALVGAIRK